MAAAMGPALPTLPADAVLEVFTHPSLVGLPDNARYSAVGEAQCKATIAHILFFVKPPLSQGEIVERQQRCLNDGVIIRSVKFYKIDTRLRCLPDRREEILASTVELRNLFYAYMGGIIIHCGHTIFNDFLRSFLVHSGDIDVTDNIPGFPATSPPAVTSSVKSEPFEGALTSPTSPVSTPTSTSPSTQQNNTARLNEIATQRKFKVEYIATSAGPSHAPTWTISVKCDGREIALATSSDKRQAKDIAAGQALRALEWNGLDDKKRSWRTISASLLDQWLDDV